MVRQALRGMLGVGQIVAACRSKSKEYPVPEQTNEPITHVSRDRGHDPRGIANALIRLGRDNAQPRDPLQIVKLTYLCHGWMLGLYHRRMSSDPVYAWQYGPVIPAVYEGVKRYGRKPVLKLIPCPDDSFDELENDLIDQVFNVYRQFSGIDLSMMTHARGTPWHQIWYQNVRNARIPDELIEEHFSELAGKQ